MERTLVLIKPDAFQRELVGEIINRIERKGLKIVGMKMIRPMDEVIKQHYSHLTDKPFFKNIKAFMTSTPLLALCVEGLNVVDTLRTSAGITLSRKADPGTIRGDWAMSVQCNLIHASDSIETATSEIARFFDADELFSYNKILDPVIYSPDELKELTAKEN